MKKILITGATGFIGGRLAEVACERKIPVVGLVRTWSHAARLARLPVQMAYGDVLDLDSLRAAMKGCDVVFHCAVDNRLWGPAHRRVSVEGTANVMQAALETGVKRVVHVSSTAVFSYEPEPEAATEEGVYHYSGDDYCQGKIEAEKVARRYHQEHGLPVTVLRPTIVYGPFGDYSVETISLIRQGRMVLVNGGQGICNSLYVDNLIEALLIAAEHDRAVGEIFHISDTSPVTWKEYIEAHARALGDVYLPLPEMTVQEIMVAIEAAEATRVKLMKHRSSTLRQTFNLIRDQRTRQALRTIPVVDRLAQAGKGVVQTLLPASTRHALRQKLLNNNTNGLTQSDAQPELSLLLSRGEVNMFTCYEKIAFSIDKARRVLGYDPKIDFSEGMKRTAAWIKWARL
jgi:nucleoside-diphosphate-sugar epimerase